MMALFFGDRYLIAQADVQGKLLVDFEIILRVPGVVRPVERGVVRVAETASTGNTKQEGSPVGAAVGNVRIPCPCAAEADSSVRAVVVQAAIDALQIVHPELHAVSPLDPRNLFLEVRSPLARIGKHTVAPANSSRRVCAGRSRSERCYRSRNIGRLCPRRRSVAHVAGSLDNMAVIIADGEVVQQVRPD